MSTPPPRDVAEGFSAGAWEFSPAVVDVFDEHVAANVPHYGVIQDLIAHLSDWLAPDRSIVADLGASTGTTTRAISERHPTRAVTFHLYDLEPLMLDAARRKHASSPHDVAYHSVDVTTPLRHRDADLTLALFLLQFLRREDRAAALAQARASARLGSVLLLAEKVEQPSALWAEIANEATWDQKAAAGLDDHVVRSKARALRGVLDPAPVAFTEALLERTGWAEYLQVWRWHQWCVWAATATPVTA